MSEKAEPPQICPRFGAKVGKNYFCHRPIIPPPIPKLIWNINLGAPILAPTFLSKTLNSSSSSRRKVSRPMRIVASKPCFVKQNQQQQKMRGDF